MRLVPIMALVAVAALMLPASPPARAANLTVLNLNDSGLGSLRDAILTANGLGGNDTIAFIGGLIGTINLATSLPSISDGLTVNGPGAGAITINACATCWILDIPAATVNVNNLTLRGAGLGAVRTAGTVGLDSVVIQNNSGGGVIQFGGAVSVTNSTVSGNTVAAATDGAGISVHGGGLTVTTSTFTGNTTAGRGGGISSNPGTNVTISSSLFNGNTATGLGGGLYVRGPVVVTNSTFSGNNSVAGGGGMYNSSTVSLFNATFNDNFNGALRTGTVALNTVTARNTIIAQGSGSGANCTATTFISLGGNISSDASCIFGGTGDRTNINPLLGALANNGGPTRSHLPTTGSPAIDGGTNAGCPSTDQRGLPRPADGDNNGTLICDAGAIEVQAIVTTPPPPETPAPAPTPPITPAPPPPIPQMMQNPAAVLAVMGGIGNGTRNNTPVPARPAVVTSTDPGAVPVLRPPSTGDAGLAPHPTSSIFDGERAQP
jgi:predicted outer membrane repeat protein